MEPIIVSVCVQTYQQVNFIRNCLDGILMQQTAFPYEIIIGEDESNDGTRKICKEYAIKHPDKIKLFLRSRNDVIYIKGNATGRFNFMESLKACKGKYIALCEGDDYWTDPLKLQKQVDFLEANPNYGICFHNIKIFNQEIKEFLEDTITRNVDESTDINELAKGNYIHTPSVMLRNDFTIPDWFIESPIGDWSLYMLAINDKKIKKLDDVMAVYRIHDTSIWSGLSQEIRRKKTNTSIKLICDNLKLPEDVLRKLRSRFKIKKHKSFTQKILLKLKNIFNI